MQLVHTFVAVLLTPVQMETAVDEGAAQTNGGKKTKRQKRQRDKKSERQKDLFKWQVLARTLLKQTGGAITAAKFPKLSRTNPPPLRCTPPSAISALIHQENTKRAIQQNHCQCCRRSCAGQT